MTVDEVMGLLEEYGWHKGKFMEYVFDNEWFKGTMEIRLSEGCLTFYGGAEWTYGDSYAYDDLTFVDGRLVDYEGGYVAL